MVPRTWGAWLPSSPTPSRQLPVTESLALPPVKGAHHVSNPIGYAALFDVPKGDEVDACEGGGWPQDALHRLRSTRSNESA
jgi:hypothetical protein